MISRRTALSAGHEATLATRIVLALALSLISLPGLAQSTAGRVLGSVTDQSGAAVPGASVAIRSVDQNITSNIETNESGNYVFPNLQPGTYTVTCEAPGFRKAQVSKVLVEVNLSGEEGKGGIEPSELDAFIERCPVTVSGLMTMPPFTEDPEASRPYFARLAGLASDRGLERLSMGTSQDWPVAVEEGATIVRLGSILWA